MHGLVLVLVLCGVRPVYPKKADGNVAYETLRVSDI